MKKKTVIPNYSAGEENIGVAVMNPRNEGKPDGSAAEDDAVYGGS